MDMGIIAGVNRAFLLPAEAVAVKGFSVSGLRAGVILRDGYGWKPIPFQRDSGKYGVSLKSDEPGQVISHTVELNVLSNDAALLHVYQNYARQRHVVCLILNTGKTVIFGLDTPARMVITPYTQGKPGDGIGFGVNINCDSKISIESYAYIETNSEIISEPVSGYGFLYNSFTLNVNKSLIKETGWRLYTETDVNKLIAIAVTPNKLATGTDWVNSFFGTLNDLNFSAIPCGQRYVLWNTSYFIHYGMAALYWMLGKDNDLTFVITPSSLLIENFSVNYQPLPMWLKSGKAIRFVKNYDGKEFEKNVTDADGNVYEVVLIGDLLWTNSDFRSTKYIDGTPINLAQTSSEWEILGENSMPARCVHPKVNDYVPF